MQLCQGSCPVFMGRKKAVGCTWKYGASKYQRQFCHQKKKKNQKEKKKTHAGQYFVRFRFLFYGNQHNCLWILVKWDRCWKSVYVWGNFAFCVIYCRSDFIVNSILKFFIYCLCLCVCLTEWILDSPFDSNSTVLAESFYSFCTSQS